MIGTEVDAEEVTSNAAGAPKLKRDASPAQTGLTANSSDRRRGVSVFRRAHDWLRENASSQQTALLNALPAHVAVLDGQGVITSVNEVWRHYVNTEPMNVPGPQVGSNYFEIHDGTPAAESSEAQRIFAGVRSVLDGAAKLFSI